MPTRRFRTILTARLLLQSDNKVLFLAQTPQNGGGYSLPGGKVEGDEFLKEGLIRECFEEIDIVLTKAALKMVFVLHKRLRSSNEIIFIFQATEWTGTPLVKETDKFKDYLWVETGKLPPTLNASLKAVFKALAKERNYASFPKKKKLKEGVLKESVRKEPDSGVGVKQKKKNKEENNAVDLKPPKNKGEERKKISELQPVLEGSMEDIFELKDKNLAENTDAPNGEL
jgi:ADP-ribose pyrophosphatase YjhB (NUDIX family)